VRLGTDSLLGDVVIVVPASLIKMLAGRYGNAVVAPFFLEITTIPSSAKLINCAAGQVSVKRMRRPSQTQYPFEISIKCNEGKMVQD
jgi:hypothetical protein